MSEFGTHYPDGSPAPMEPIPVLPGEWGAQTYSGTLTAECTCPLEARGPEDCTECPAHDDAAQEELRLEHQSEIDAENAWLRAAEAPTPEDLAFERYEHDMGLF